MEVLRVKSNCVVAYRSTVGREVTERQLSVLKENWRAVEYTGKISAVTQSKIKQMIGCWSDSINTYNSQKCNWNLKRKRSLKFLTLTISKPTTYTDNEVKRKLLIPFITKLKRMFHVEHYFWRAEAQENGNIHFHLIIDQYIKKEAVNFEWDKSQHNAGITDIAPKWNEKYQSPSTRIEECKSQKYIAAYVVKYCLKDEEFRKINGRIWGCSDELKNLKYCEFNDCVEVCEEFSSIVKESECRVFESDNYKIYCISLLYDECAKKSWLKTMIEDVMIDNYTMLYPNDRQIYIKYLK